MYYWYFYKESFYDYDEIEHSAFGNGLSNRWQDMIESIIDFFFEEVKNGNYCCKATYSTVRYFHTEDLNGNIFKKLNMSDIEHIMNKVEEKMNEYNDKENKKRENALKRKEIAKTITTLKNCNKDITNEQIMNILNLTPSQFKEFDKK